VAVTVLDPAGAAAEAQEPIPDTSVGVVHKGVDPMLKVTVPVGVPLDDVTSARNVTELPKSELVGVTVVAVVEAEEKIRIGKVAVSTVL
jgi:hypothetical protein